MAFCHRTCKYSTHGESNIINAQPIEDNCFLCQIALAHNGNLTNAVELKNSLKIVA